MDDSTPTLFGKIIKKEIPADIVYEDDLILAFKDIHPQAAVHVLIIPKKPLTCLRCATQKDAALLAHILLKTNEIAESLGIKEQGYRLITNAGKNGGQEVPHLHFHLLGGEPLGGNLNGR